MKRNVMLWSTLRRPVRSLLFLLVLAVASFAFVAKATEYLVVDQETQRLEEFYRPIGYLEPKIVDDPQEIANDLEAWWLMDVTQGVPVVSGSPYVDWVEQKRYSSGILQGMQNTDLDGWSSDSSFREDYFAQKPTYDPGAVGLHVTDLFLSGTLVSKGELPEPEQRRDRTMTEDWYAHRFLFEVDQVEAGYLDYAPEGTQVQLLYLARNPEEIEAFYTSVQEGQRYLIKASADSFKNGYSWTPDGGIDLQWVALQEELPFYPLEPGETVNWETPALQDLQNKVAVLRENTNAMAVIGVKDMSALPRMQEELQNYFLMDGRWLNHEDNEQGRRVCVVHQDFAALRGLSVGDTLTLKLRDLKAPLSQSQSFWGYSGVDITKDRMLIQDAYILEGSEDWDHWQAYPTQTETFEIVGLYRSDHDPAYAPYASGSINLYIPDACMPEGYGQDAQVHMDTYSFRLRSAEDTQAFLQAVEGPLADLGLRVKLIDKGWDNFAASAKPIQRASLLNAAVFTLVLTLVLALFAFLYLRQKRGEFAIQRALGVGKGTAVRRMLVPVTLLGILGILAGGLPAWGYALGQAGQTLSTLPNAESVAMANTLPIGWLLGLCGVALILLLAFTAIGALRMAHRPVLALLQGEAARKGAARR